MRRSALLSARVRIKLEAMRSFVAASLFLWLAGCANIVMSNRFEGDYSKRIIGRWGHQNRIVTFHANGTWGVQRHEDAPEGIGGRRWRVEGKRLLLTFLSDNGLGTPVHLETQVSTITSFSDDGFTVKLPDGSKENYGRER